MRAVRINQGRGAWVRRAARIVVLGAAAALAFFPPPAAWVERFYAGGFFPRLQSCLTPLSNRVPFHVGDLLLVALALGLPVWSGVRIARAGCGGRVRALGGVSLSLLTLAAFLFLGFQALWGLNYGRVPLARRVDYDPERLTPDALKRLARVAVEQMNAESAVARGKPWPGRAALHGPLLRSFDANIRALGDRGGFAPAVPKASLLGGPMASSGVAGFIDPFTHEVVLDPGLLPAEKPFTLAHEWAHLAGYADESEANFVAFLACVRSGDARLRYAGWLALYQHLPPAGREERARLAPAVLADLRAIDRRIRRRVDVRISERRTQVYDRFLKANRVPAGIASYGLMIHLVLGTRFEPGWVPVRRKIPICD